MYALTEPLSESNIPNHIKSITLEPMTEVETPVSVRVLGQSLGEDIGALIHEFLIVNQRAHRIQTRESLSRFSYH
jgi:hypothetical protein